MAAAAENVTPIEKEAADEPITFEFKGETWEVQDGFRPLRFQRLAERNLLSEALEQALGEDQYLDLEDMIESMTEVQEACEALSKALTPGDSGNSRASRRSSARKRPARR
jgi:replication initiation and membrane attachment protein DnaB